MDSGLIDTTISFISCGHGQNMGWGRPPSHQGRVGTISEDICLCFLGRENTKKIF